MPKERKGWPGFVLVSANRIRSVRINRLLTTPQLAALADMPEGKLMRAQRLDFPAHHKQRLHAEVLGRVAAALRVEVGVLTGELPMPDGIPEIPPQADVAIDTKKVFALCKARGWGLMELKARAGVYDGALCASFRKRNQRGELRLVWLVVGCLASALGVCVLDLVAQDEVTAQERPILHSPQHRPVSKLGEYLLSHGWTNARPYRALNLRSNTKTAGWYTGIIPRPRAQVELADATGLPLTEIQALCEEQARACGQWQANRWTWPKTSWGHLLSRAGQRPSDIAGKLGVLSADVRAWARTNRGPTSPEVIARLDALLTR